MPRDSPSAGGVGGTPARGAHTRARRAGVIRWYHLGEKGGRHYYIGFNRSAGLVAPCYFEDTWDFNSNSEMYIRIIDDVCEQAHAAPAAYVWLPRDAPPLLCVKTNGEIWLAVEDWPRPQTVLRVGRLPYNGPEALCNTDPLLDAMRRARTQHVYVRILRKRMTMFHFQVKNYTVIVAESLR